jgi:hypothetical protein
MTQVGVPVPRTVILPSRDLPTDTSDDSFSNLEYPLDWNSIFAYVGFPAYMKPFAGGGWKNVYRLAGPDEFFEKHNETGQLVMLLQEEIVFEEYYRCYCIGGKYIRIMSYEPRNAHHLRYVADFKPSQERLAQMEEIVLKINHSLGYDFNTPWNWTRDGIPYAIDFVIPLLTPNVRVWARKISRVVETMSNYAIERAMHTENDKDNLTWVSMLKRVQMGLRSL